MFWFLLGFIIGCIITIIYNCQELKKIKKLKRKEYDHLCDYYSVPKDDNNEFGV